MATSARQAFATDHSTYWNSGVNPQGLRRLLRYIQHVQAEGRITEEQARDLSRLALATFLGYEFAPALDRFSAKIEQMAAQIEQRFSDSTLNTIKDHK